MPPYGLPDADITVTGADRIERHASTGKLRRFIALSEETLPEATTGIEPV